MKLYHSLRLATALALLIPAQTAFAETPPATVTKAAQTPWLYENSDVPVDSSWTFGVLNNGVRYAVKRNVVPQARFRSVSASMQGRCMKKKMNSALRT